MTSNLPSDATIYLAGLMALTHRVRHYAAHAAEYAMQPVTAPDMLENAYEESFKQALRKVAEDLLEMVDGLPDDETFLKLIAAEAAS